MLDPPLWGSEMYPPNACLPHRPTLLQEQSLSLQFRTMIQPCRAKSHSGIQNVQEHSWSNFALHSQFPATLWGLLSHHLDFASFPGRRATAAGIPITVHSESRVPTYSQVSKLPRIPKSLCFLPLSPSRIQSSLPSGCSGHTVPSLS